MASDKPGTTSTPVYIPYATFVSALDALKRDGIPGTGKIDKSLWDTQSGAIQGQILIGFRFLGLIDEHNRVLPGLPALVNASAEERKPMLKKFIEGAYSKLLALDLRTISQGQLDQALREYNIGGSTLTRAARFFVKACQETGIPISSRVSGKTQPGAPGAPTQTRRRGRGSVGRREPIGTTTMNGGTSTGAGQWEEKLLEKFPVFDPSWPDALKTQWFEGFGRLMKAKSE
jgi:hypothetical protein